MYTVSLGTREVGVVANISSTCPCQQTLIIDAEKVMKSKMAARSLLL